MGFNSGFKGLTSALHLNLGGIFGKRKENLAALFYYEHLPWGNLRNVMVIYNLDTNCDIISALLSSVISSDCENSLCN